MESADRKTNLKGGLEVMKGRGDLKADERRTGKWRGLESRLKRFAAERQGGHKANRSKIARRRNGGKFRLGSLFSPSRGTIDQEHDTGGREKIIAMISSIYLSFSLLRISYDHYNYDREACENGIFIHKQHPTSF